MIKIIFFFRFWALWAGVMSLLLWFVYMPTKYLIADKSFYEQFIWIPIVHGFTYPFYVFAALLLCIVKRKSLLSTGLFLLAGTLPVASIWIERRVKSGRW
jgi:integral membrane protein